MLSLRPWSSFLVRRSGSCPSTSLKAPLWLGGASPPWYCFHCYCVSLIWAASRLFPSISRPLAFAPPLPLPVLCIAQLPGACSSYSLDSPDLIEKRCMGMFGLHPRASWSRWEDDTGRSQGVWLICTHGSALAGGYLNTYAPPPTHTHTSTICSLLEC